MEPAGEFLSTLWPSGVPSGRGVQLWRLDGQKSFTFANLDAAAVMSKGQEDIYISAGLAPSARMSQKQRVRKETVAGVPGIWADIDVNGGPEGKTGAAPTVEEALELAYAVLEPTVIVNSGYGIQAWWLFDEPWEFGSEPERAQAQRLVTAYQATLRARAKKMGWTIDTTHDLSRLMRLPGTENAKGKDSGFKPVPVTLMEFDGPRYDIESISEVAQEHMNVAIAAQQRITGEGIDIILRGKDVNPPILKIDELKSIDSGFAQVWDHTVGARERSKWSMSSYEMSIANYLVRAGFSDQEIADCLVYHRLRFEPGDPKGKAGRPDYISATIGKARAGVEQEEEEADIEAERDEAVQQLSALSRAEAPDPVRATSLFSSVVGGPEVKRLIQDGRDPEHAQFRLELADGREVPLGPAANMISQDRFRERFMVVTSVLPKRCKNDKWDDVIRALLKTATVNEEDSRVAIVHGWLEGYLDYNLSNDRDAACLAMDPFEHEDDVCIYAQSLNQWLRRVRSMRMKDTEIHQYLHAAGFERKSVTYTKDNGRRSQRSYWVTAKESLPFL